MNKFKMLIITAFLPFLSACWEVENGEKVGEIIDLKQSGAFIKTWECKIIRGGLQDGSGTIGTSIQLTIEDKNLLDKAKRYMVERKFVFVKYHREYLTLFRSESDNCFMDSIKEINNGETEND